MRNHARVLTAIWQDEEFIGLSLDAQWLYIVVLSQPNLSLVGVIAYTPGRWVNYCPQLTPKRLSRALQELVEGRFLLLDEKTQEVAVRSFLRHDGVLGNPNMLKAAVRDFESVLSPTLREEVREGIRNDHRKAFDMALAMPSEMPFEMASATPLERRTTITPSPSPTSTPNSLPPNPPRSADGPVAAEAGEDEDEGAQPSRVQEAISILARRDLDRAVARGDDIRNRASWLRAARATRDEVDGSMLSGLHAQHPDWTATRLANVIDPQPPRVPEYVTEGIGNGAVLKRVDES